MGQKTMNLDLACITNSGSRTINQDFAGYERYGNICCLVVADGVGGCQYGEYAAYLAVESICQSFQKEPIVTEVVLHKHIQEASQHILDIIQKHPEMHTMHTTIAVVYLDENHVVVGHVGDSRIYIFHKGKIVYCSQDHSLVMQKVLKGELQADEIRSHPKRNIITSALGSQLPKQIDTRKIDFPFIPQDGILLCSDGFWELILEDEMLELLSISETTKQWVSEMERLVSNRQSSRSDNYTCLAAMVFPDC